MNTSQPLSRRDFLKLSALFAGALGLPPLCKLLLAPQSPTTQADSDLDAFIQTQMTAAHIPGLAAGIVKEGQVVWARGYGWANIVGQIPVTPDTLFMLASVSKTVTAVALMQLYDDGLFGLDDDVNAHLPFSVRNPNHPGLPITPRMLLTHTSSIWDNWDVLEALYVEGDSPIPLGAFCENYLVPGGEYYDAAENFDDRAPGAAYEYSNIGAALCGYLAERLAGVSFEQHCQQRLFGPLGMAETSWHLAGLDPNHIAIPYTYEDGQYQPHAHYGYPDYPNGALRTSVLQLARFLIAFINGGVYQGRRILQAETVNEMRAVQFPALAPDQGLLWYYDDGLFGHEGGDTGALTRMFFHPADGVGVVTLANGEPENEQPFYNIEARLFAEADRMSATRIHLPLAMK